MENNENVNQQQSTDSAEMSFAQLFEESLTVANEGDVVAGTIIGLSNDIALVDIGDKSESQIPLAEFKKEGEGIEVNVGDTFDVFVEKREPDKFPV